jgi:N-acyl-D-aspartate/D-glutamate deacylase
VRDGRVVAVTEPGTIDEPARDTFDATGHVVCPGFVDPHTHYDAQLFWDPLASPSNVHGVTSIVAGNCGFTLAPLHAEDADYLRRMMAKVEGMPLAALENGVTWDWETFAEYLDRLDGRIGLNAGFMVGHCALRRYVMGADAVGHEATPGQLDAMVALLHASIEAGGLGFSTTLSSTHSDGDGAPGCSPSARRSASTRARSSRGRSRAGSTSSPTTRSSWWRPCPAPPAGRSTGTCSRSTRPFPTGCPASWRRPTGPPRWAGGSWP